MMSGINEIVVTGPDSPVLTSLDDLSGEDIVLHKSSNLLASYWVHVERLNERFKTENKAPVKLHAAPEDLEDDRHRRRLESNARVCPEEANTPEKISCNGRPH
jgi:hypothetical protein